MWFTVYHWSLYLGWALKLSSGCLLKFGSFLSKKVVCFLGSLSGRGDWGGGGGCAELNHPYPVQTITYTHTHKKGREKKKTKIVPTNFALCVGGFLCNDRRICLDIPGNDSPRFRDWRSLRWTGRPDQRSRASWLCCHRQKYVTQCSVHVYIIADVGNLFWEHRKS